MSYGPGLVMTRRGWLVVALLAPLTLIAIGIQLTAITGTVGLAQLALAARARGSAGLDRGVRTVQAATTILDATWSSPAAPGARVQPDDPWRLPSGTFAPGTLQANADPQALSIGPRLQVRVIPAPGTPIGAPEGWMNADGALIWTGLPISRCTWPSADRHLPASRLRAWLSTRRGRSGLP